MAGEIEIAETELKRLRGLFEAFSNLGGQDEMTDAKFAEIVSHVVNEELSFPIRNLRV